MSDTTLGVFAFYDPRDKHPYVLLSVGTEQVQLTAEMARNIAMQLIDCSAISEQDAFLTDFLGEKLGVDPTKLGSLLKEFKGWRVQNQSKGP